MNVYYTYMHKVLRQNFQYYISYMGKGYCRQKNVDRRKNSVILEKNEFVFDWSILHIFQFFAGYYYMSFVKGSLCMCGTTRTCVRAVHVLFCINVYMYI